MHPHPEQVIPIDYGGSGGIISMPIAEPNQTKTRLVRGLDDTQLQSRGGEATPVGIKGVHGRHLALTARGRAHIRTTGTKSYVDHQVA